MFAAAWLMVMFLLVAFSLLTAWRVSKRIGLLANQSVPHADIGDGQ